MGVGERSEALLNIKAMGEKMLCPPREPGLRPPPPPSLSPLLNPTSIKALTLRFPMRLWQHRMEQQPQRGTQTAGTRSPAQVGPPRPALHPTRFLSHSLIPFWGGQAQGKESS